MKLKISSERDNPHMKRKELQVQIEHEGEPTPRTDAVQALVAKQFSFDEQKTEVKHIFSASGAPSSDARVFVWADKKPEKKEKKEAKKKAKG
jgi:ribosomal protein S24E